MGIEFESKVMDWLSLTWEQAKAKMIELKAEVGALQSLNFKMCECQAITIDAIINLHGAYDANKITKAEFEKQEEKLVSALKRFNDTHGFIEGMRYERMK